MLFTVFQLGLLYLDDGVGHGRAVGIEDDYIGALGRVAAEGDGILDREALERIAVVLR